MWWWPTTRLFLVAMVVVGVGVAAYTHTPCHTRALQAQFQFPNCYIPPLNPNLLLSQASLVMSHNAATSYIPRRNSLSKTGLAWRYAQNQAPGTVYDQLQNGARALDVRPALLWRNHAGTVTLQHGSIHIPVTLDAFVQDVLRWCHEHPEELVVVLPSHFEYYPSATTKFRTSSSSVHDDDDTYFDYQNEEGQWNDDDRSNMDTDDGDDDDATAISSTMTTRIAQILANLGVSYYTCADVYDITVGQAMEMASLDQGGGYLLVLDGHDYYGTSCAKENWIESQLVTCYNSKRNNVTNQTIPCTRPSDNKNDVSWQRLQQYMYASTNNPATDAWNVLGPPLSHESTPFNTIPAHWQVTTAAVVAGLTHGSSILQDNRQSHVNARIVEWVYQSNYNYYYYNNNGGAAAAISLLAVDNVALNGNALLSVVRNQCGQQQQQQPSSLQEDDGSVLPCGTALPLPRMTDADWTAQQWILLVVALLYSIWMVYSVVVYQRPRLLYTFYARGRTAWQQHQQQRQQQQYYQNRKQQDLLSKEKEKADYPPPLD